VVKMEPHDLATSALTARLTGAIVQHVRSANLGMTLAAGCGFRCWPGHETVRVTDASFSSHETIPPNRDPRDYPRWAPDLIVEVVSPFEHMATVLGRITMFLQAGTQQVWLVDPSSRTVTIVRHDAVLPTIGLGDALDGGNVLPGFVVSAAEVFSEGS
jgi:Uma2 family endonuclease